MLLIKHLCGVKVVIIWPAGIVKMSIMVSCVTYFASFMAILLLHMENKHNKELNKYT